MVVSKNKLLIELINNQRQNIDSDKKLDIKDLHRICKNLNGSIFGNSKCCCLWQGYVTNISDSNTKYINFFFKKKKYALHRLLYENFIDEIDKSEYLRFSCENKGICCNLNHIKKITRKKKKDVEIIDDIKDSSENLDNNEITNIESENKEKDIVIKKNNKLSKEKDNNDNDNTIDIVKTKSKNNLNKLIIIF